MRDGVRLTFWIYYRASHVRSISLPINPTANVWLYRYDESSFLSENISSFYDYFIMA